MSNLNITITEAAQVYLRELLAKQNSDGIAVRIFVENAGTPKAEWVQVGRGLCHRNQRHLP